MEEHRQIEETCLTARDERDRQSYTDRSAGRCMDSCSMGLISTVKPECSMWLGRRYELSCLRSTRAT
jgi:hypothetical protein